MSRRGQEGPMDFEYADGVGPVDARSPFANVSHNVTRRPGPSDLSAKKRSFSTFGSPTKSTPSLRAPASQPHFFSQPTIPSAPRGGRSSPDKPLPPNPVPAWNGMFSTPRKLDRDTYMDESSGGETPKSPDRNDDSELATPETKQAQESHILRLAPLSKYDPSAMPTFTAGNSSAAEEVVKEKEKRRAPQWFSRAIEKWHSPGRGEVPRGEHYSHKLEKRIVKKRARDMTKQLARRRRSQTTDDEESPLQPHTTRKSSRQPPQPHQPNAHLLAQILTFVHDHPTLPHTLSYWAQYAFNLFLLTLLACIIYSFWAAIAGDVDKKSHEAMSDMLAEMATCAQQYTANDCAPASQRKPALQVVCEQWGTCMRQEAQRVGRAKVSAHTFAEIFNAFVEPMSWKAIIFSFALVFAAFGAPNVLFGHFRNKAQQQQQQQQAHHHYYAPPPPTPQRSFSNAQGGQGGEEWYGTPFHQQLQGLEPAPSGVHRIEGQGSPVRRLQY